MTYTEKNNEEPFDWNAFLNKKEITQEEWENASELSADWVTCACGNQCDLIPRYIKKNTVDVGGRPNDDILSHWGLEFNDSIQCQEVELSIFFLAKIEQRSAYILANL